MYFAIPFLSPLLPFKLSGTLLQAVAKALDAAGNDGSDTGRSGIIGHRALVGLAGAMEKVQVTCSSMAKVVEREWCGYPGKFDQVRDTSEVALIAWRAPLGASGFLSMLAVWVSENASNEHLCTRPRILWQYLRCLGVAL